MNLPPRYEFRTEYQPTDDGKGIKAVDWVDVTPRGAEKYTTTPMRIVDIQRMIDPGSEGSSLWEYLQPRYEAYKKGEEVPETGTPLGAWPGVTSSQVKILKKSEIRTVEDIASIHEDLLSRIPLPNMRQLQQQAKAYIANLPQQQTAAEVAELRLRQQEVAEENAELRAAIARLEAGQMERDHDPDTKRRPGRPRKADDEAAAA